jgi:sigma-B regulation protein RsbU (phosphoserine phosphatase)
MIAAPTPKDETERLADLQALRVLDTPPEDRFNRLVELAAQVFSAPIAYIAMVDADRQWFKAKCGLTVDQTGREVSFCGHAICQDEPMIVPDAAKDPRFFDNPLVVGEPHVRFYAGNRLRGPGGRNVGTFCIADTRPREMTKEQVQLLKRLSAVAEHELNLVGLVETQRQLLEAKNRLAAAQARLAGEVAEAAAYLRSMLPEKLRAGPVRTDYRFEPSSELGGDLLGHHWLDDQQRQLAFYMVDACGHGVGSSLLSVSVGHALRRQSLPRTPFDDPGKVLGAINRAFPMDERNYRFVTVWYGVYDIRTRRLRYSSGGHPPAVYLNGQDGPISLGQNNILLGFDPHATYETQSLVLSPGSRLYVFSDGAFEARDPEGEMFGLDRLNDLLVQAPPEGVNLLDHILRRVREFSRKDDFEDDVTLLELELA